MQTFYWDIPASPGATARRTESLWRGLMTEFAVWFCLFWVWHVLGISIGYHRFLAHRSFRCPKAVEYFFVAGGYLAFESSPIWWATLHRAHHRHVDTALDPHSPRFGNYRAYMGWIFMPKYPEHIDPQLQAPDLVGDPVYKWLERCNDVHGSHLTNSAIGFGTRLVMWILFGWKIALASVLAGLIVQQLPFMTNLLCHKPRLGYKNFEGNDDSVNIWWLSPITLGDNWHNNHHAFPGSARSGFRWFEIDPSWLTIKLLAVLRLVSHVNKRFNMDGALAATEDLPLPATAVPHLQ
jgi:fatty-acid desaturase